MQTETIKARDYPGRYSVEVIELLCELISAQRHQSAALARQCHYRAADSKAELGIEHLIPGNIFEERSPLVDSFAASVKKEEHH